MVESPSDRVFLTFIITYLQGWLAETPVRPHQPSQGELMFRGFQQWILGHPNDSLVGYLPSRTSAEIDAVKMSVGIVVTTMNAWKRRWEFISAISPVATSEQVPKEYEFHEAHFGGAGKVATVQPHSILGDVEVFAGRSVKKVKKTDGSSLPEGDVITDAPDLTVDQLTDFCTRTDATGGGNFVTVRLLCAGATLTLSGDVDHDDDDESDGAATLPKSKRKLFQDLIDWVLVALFREKVYDKELAFHFINAFRALLSVYIQFGCSNSIVTTGDWIASQVGGTTGMIGKILNNVKRVQRFFAPYCKEIMDQELRITDVANILGRPNGHVRTKTFPDQQLLRALGHMMAVKVDIVDLDQETDTKTFDGDALYFVQRQSSSGALPDFLGIFTHYPGLVDERGVLKEYYAHGEAVALADVKVINGRRVKAPPRDLKDLNMDKRWKPPDITRTRKNCNHFYRTKIWKNSFPVGQSDPNLETGGLKHAFPSASYLAQTCRDPFLRMIDQYLSPYGPPLAVGYDQEELKAQCTDYLIQNYKEEPSALKLIQDQHSRCLAIHATYKACCGDDDDYEKLLEKPFSESMDQSNSAVINIQKAQKKSADNLQHEVEISVEELSNLLKQFRQTQTVTKALANAILMVRGSAEQMLKYINGLDPSTQAAISARLDGANGGGNGNKQDNPAVIRNYGHL